MLDWVNTLPIDSCLLVSSISDLYSGEVLCEIFNFIYNNGEQGQFYDIISRDQNRKSAISNFQLLLSSYPSNDKIKKLLAGRKLEEIIEVG